MRLYTDTDIGLLQDLVFEANQQNKYTTKKEIAKIYNRIKGTNTRLEGPRALQILNLLETPQEKVDRVFAETLSSSKPVDLKYVKTAKVKAASDATPWRSKIAKEVDLDIAYTNRLLKKNKNYLKNKKLFDYLSASQLLKTELKDLPLGAQLEYAEQAILGRPRYTGMRMSTAGGKVGRILRDPAHKVMEFALRNFNQNKGQGAVKFLDSKGKPIKYKPGTKIPYQKASFMYEGVKHNVKDLRKPGYMQKFFPEVYENQTAINKLLNRQVSNPFKRGKLIAFGDLMSDIQVKGYGWSPQAGVLDILHGEKGVRGEPFKNLRFGTKRLNTVLRDIEVGRFGKGLKRKLSTQAFGELSGLAGDDLAEGILKQQTGLAERIAKGATFPKAREEVITNLLRSGTKIGPRELDQIRKATLGIVSLTPAGRLARALRLFKSEGGSVEGEVSEIIIDPNEKLEMMARIKPYDGLDRSTYPSNPQQREELFETPVEEPKKRSAVLDLEVA